MSFKPALRKYVPGDIFIRMSSPAGARLVYAVVGDAVHYVRLHDGIKDTYHDGELERTSIYVGNSQETLKSYVEGLSHGG